MKNFSKIVVGIVLGWYLSACDLFENNLSNEVWSDDVSVLYFGSRGFNIRFKELYLVREDIISDQIEWESFSNVNLNIGGIIINTSDIVTLAEEKF